MPAAPSITLHAHAKLNLALAVGPPQPPRGYHPIASWFVPIALHDTLTLTRLPGDEPSRFDIRWASDAPRPSLIDWPIEQDLAVRAHAMLEARARRALPVHMLLEKRIPVGGGLGGGSSDAAAMLRSVNTLLDLGLSISDLREMSGTLGSDIAFFLDDAAVPRAAIVTGFGERIERLPSASGAPVILIIPPFGCPTGEVYRAFDAAPTTHSGERRVRALAAPAPNHIQPAALFNDLAAPACIVQPRLADALRDLRAALGPETPIHITGSGSTMFCLPSATTADRTAASIRAASPEAFVLTTTIL